MSKVIHLMVANRELTDADMLRHRGLLLEVYAGTIPLLYMATVPGKAGALVQNTLQGHYAGACDVRMVRETNSYRLLRVKSLTSTPSPMAA